MLDERPPAELPARASAMAGASARVAQKKSARRIRQLGSRLDMDLLVRKPSKGRKLGLIWVRAESGVSASTGISLPIGSR